MKTHFFILIFLFLINGCGQGNDNFKELKVNGIDVRVEVADNVLEKFKGLSDRDSLPHNHGMLFVYSRPGRRSFWMYHCKFSIDVAFIDKGGKIIEIITMEKEPYNRHPDSLKTYRSESSEVKYALEMMGGWFKENGIQAGDSIKF